MISDERIKSIFKKLPIGYYLGRNVRTVVLDEDSDGSYYAPLIDKVSISLKMIRNGISRINENEYSENEVESLIRGLLYHELSHIILSQEVMNSVRDTYERRRDWWMPDNFQELFNNKRSRYLDMYKNIINIFEDERIETILSRSFLNTNFKKNLVRLVDINDYSDNDPLSKFYKIVRFRVGDTRFVDKVVSIISKFSNITDEYDSRRYQYEVLDLYVDVYNSIPKEDINEEFDDGDWEDNNYESDNNNDSQSSSDNNSNQSSSSDSQEDNESNNSSNNSDSSSDDNHGQIIKKLIDALEDDNSPNKIKEIMDQMPKDIKELAEEIISQNLNMDKITEKDHVKTQVINENVDQKLVDQINKIFNDSKNLAKKNSSAVNSYSGVFDPRSAGREDFRFFVNRSRNGSSKMYSKYNLNLYVDCSGSFSSSEDAVNKLLYALKLAEKSNPNFTLNVATIGDGVHKFDFSKEHAFVCNQGTALDRDIFPIVKSYTSPNAVNRSIVLIDGDAFECGTTLPECFSAFNSKEFYLIVDMDNEDYVKRYAPRAHTIIHNPRTSNKTYNELLTERVVSALEVLTRG